MCGISYPTSISRCRVCEASTDWMSSDSPDPDWEHEVETRLYGGRESEHDRIEQWRIDYAIKLGYETGVALSLAISDADMHRLEQLIRDGCALELAARIV